MFCDYWKLCQSFWIPEETDQYWNELREALTKFTKKYNEDDFAVKLALAFLNNLENKEKEIRKNKNEQKN